MQWDEGPNAGFAPAGAEPWLPVHPRSHEINVAVQERDPDSLLHCYRRLFALRRTRLALQRGTLQLLSDHGQAPGVVAYRREATGAGSVAVFLNFSERPSSVSIGNQERATLFSSLGRPLHTAYGKTTLDAHEGVVLAGP